MNRRSFITDMLKVGVACTFLPGAGRIWKPTSHWMQDQWYPRLTDAQLAIFAFDNPDVLVDVVFTRCFDEEYLKYIRMVHGFWKPEA